MLPRSMGLCLALLMVLTQARLGASQIPPGAAAENFEVYGYSDVDGNIPFKIAIQEVDGRWYLYLGSFWVRGWSILDVTDPTAPEVVKFVPGPDNTSTVQMDFAEGRMITPLSRILPGRDFDETKPYEAGFYIWDTTDPVNPKRLGYWKSGGTHRNWYDGGRYVHTAARMEGYEGGIYVIVDVSDPANPAEAGRWWLPGQHTAGGETPLAEAGVGHHGPPMPWGPYQSWDLVYLAYGGAGMIVLDIKDVSQPKFISRFDFSPPFKPSIGTHTVVPLDRGIVFASSEAIAEECDEPLNHASLVDVADPRNPFLLSVLPLPLPPPGSPYTSFCDKGARFGPHNTNMQQHASAVQKTEDLLYLTYFNAGLRVFDISNPRKPIEVGYFIPPDPTKRYGPLPRTKLVTSTEDVLVDRRGYAYITDRNQGVWIVRYAGEERATD